MKTQIAKIALFSVVAAALMVVPAISRAQDSSTNASDATPNKHDGLRFHGKVTAVDATASTIAKPSNQSITVNDMTISITSDTKITKNGESATMADITIGIAVHGTYTKDATGNITATTVGIGRGKKPAASQ